MSANMKYCTDSNLKKKKLYVFSVPILLTNINVNTVVRCKINLKTT